MIEKRSFNKDNKIERAILVGRSSQKIPFEQAKEYLDELAFLVETAGGKAYRSFIQRLEKPIPATYVGSGKLEEIKEAVEETEADMVVFDDDLSPAQVRNIDKALGVKILDRSAIILHIFSERAKTAQAKIQVELAQYQYMLPRLTGLWSHLSKQKGGIGLKGAGEKEIETDRRIIRNKISHLKKQLKKLENQSAIRRKNRSDQIRVALVGYTNVGKSTIMNLISKSKTKVLAEDKLFATLDTTVRKVSVNGVPFLLSDTVGFIRKLPHNLVESFKGTLSEATEADILVHVVDVSHPQFEEHIEVVKETLQDVGANGQEILMVFNKIDMLPEERVTQIRNTWYARVNSPNVFISAVNRTNINDLRSKLTNIVIQKSLKKFPHRTYIQYYQ